MPRSVKRKPVLYTDNNKFCCKWIDNLIRAGELSDGVTWCGNIEWIEELDAKRYQAVHFFAGIGGWPLALKLAGWPDGREVWTGSCPCQPFSCAGKGLGEDDARHLWPEWSRLIKQHRPATVFGEQVASKLGREWLAGVFADLESVGYAVAGADLCAAGAGAPHIRQRLFWVADRSRDGRRKASNAGSDRPREVERRVGVVGRYGAIDGMADTESARRGGTISEMRRPVLDHETGGLVNSAIERLQRRRDGESGFAASGVRLFLAGSGVDVGPWSNANRLLCLDGKSRRVEPGVRPLADGIPNRVDLLRALGNSIVPQVGADFVRAFLEAEATIAGDGAGVE